jgi:hypothetical protein
MKNKHYIYLLIFLFSGSLLAFIISSVMPDNLIFTEITTEGFSLTSITGIVFLMRNGTFYKTIFFKITLGLFALISVGALFKIMHWPGANIALILGFSGTVVNYAIHYTKKQTKSLTDYLKLLWVTLSFLISLGIIMHWGFKDFAIIPQVILLVTIVHFVYTNRSNQPLLQQ